ncbi:hypothetical protein K458DRAFT_490373 [Lentithecium fluviatile CBS 122367]|uniref:CHAT domain-containing protein n=1 Tax=Lentithecium fluviatile CBS 122367 TaxID=1168545 RepID=A0A6G1INK2_9PLEO|nr:hypothetical protein K458DRAFT_490373 [Lentithecium fluviatile CBS 122367]
MASPIADPFAAYHGVYTSLYTVLSAEHVHQLEKAIWLKKTGQRDAARTIFANDLAPVNNIPVVIIEQADLEIEAGRWGRAWRLLDSALKELADVHADLDLPQHRLMMMTREMLGIRHRGDHDSAAREIERMRQWLCDLPATEYTDVQTSCISRYVIANMLSRLTSSYQNPLAEHIPRNDPTVVLSEPREPWSGLHDLRRSLTARGMFNEANNLFRVEINRTPPKDRGPFFEEFLASIADLPTSHGKHFIESAVRLQWSTTFFQLHNLPRAKEELALSETALNTWFAEFDISNTFTVPALQALLCEKLDFVGDHKVKLQVAEQFVDIFEKTGSSKTGSCLSTAAESAFALFESTGDSDYMKKCFSLYDRLQRYDELESEDLFDLVIHRNSLIDVTNKNMVDRQKSLEWIDGFLDKYDYFRSPAEMESLHTRKAMLLNGLRRFDEAKEAEDIAERYRSVGPSFGKWLHISFSNSVAPGNSTVEGEEYDSEDDDDGVFFFSPWHSVVGDTEKTVATAVNFLLDWSFEDLMGGHLTVQEFARITGIPNHLLGDLQDADGKATFDKIKGNQRENVLSFLVPSDAVSDVSQNIRWECTADWLSSAPKGQRNKRLYCLLMLRNARQYHFSNKHFWDLRIIELQHLLTLYGKLPKPIRDATRLMSQWYCELSQTYVALAEGKHNLQDPKTHEALLEADKYCDLAVKALRNEYKPNLLGIQLRFGALITILKIRQLEQQLEQASGTTDQPTCQEQTEEATSRHPDVDPSTLAKEITALRSAGLEKLKECEQIFTISELEASWLDDGLTGLDGLDGVEHRQRLSAFHGSFYTIYNAITLLLVEREPSQDTVNQVWGWVQKYKARSLTRTIGMRSAIPPSLLKLILASNDARPIYEEMLDLQKRICEAKASARFDLRQQLDAHRQRMRTHPLLRRLIDLREGTPLNLSKGQSDIAPIETEVGMPIVLVDWFFLPAYPNDAGDRLLLFTARDGSPPTMDVLTTKIQDVYAWQADYLSTQRLKMEEARHRFDAMLGGLVAPLSHRTEENEILVLCPSNTLHRLPLHALSVGTRLTEWGDDVPLALNWRNPVVYIHSHSLLRSCFSAAEHARHSPDSINARFLSGIPEEDADLFGAGRDSINDLAHIFATPPMIDGTASKPDFMKAATDSRLLHLHTHCNWDMGDPLDHHVEFPWLDEHFIDEIPDDQRARDHKLTAREVFDMTLLPGTHVNMIACQGGVTEVKLGDEVMGLVPALLHSGATSVVSTLWSIRDPDGAQFARLFFESFLQQCEGERADPLEALNRLRGALPGGTETDSASFVDVALALQYAVKSMDPHGRAPLLGWAGFVLHGFWQFSLPMGEAQWLKHRHSDIQS